VGTASNPDVTALTLFDGSIQNFGITALHWQAIIDFVLRIAAVCHLCFILAALAV
jgi:hypothetical protein